MLSKGFFETNILFLDFRRLSMNSIKILKVEMMCSCNLSSLFIFAKYGSRTAGRRQYLWVYLDFHLAQVMVVDQIWSIINCPSL